MAVNLLDLKVISDGCRPTSRCSGRASRHKIGAILKGDFVPAVIPISQARR